MLTGHSRHGSLILPSLLVGVAKKFNLAHRFVLLGEVKRFKIGLYPLRHEPDAIEPCTRRSLRIPIFDVQARTDVCCDRDPQWPVQRWRNLDNVALANCARSANYKARPCIIPAAHELEVRPAVIRVGTGLVLLQVGQAIRVGICCGCTQNIVKRAKVP